MTTEKSKASKFNKFEALYRIEASGEKVWILQLENNQVVVVREEEIRFYATDESFREGGEPTATISRKVEADAQPEAEDVEPGHLL